MDQKVISDKIDDAIRSLLELKRTLALESPTVQAQTVQAQEVKAPEEFESYDSLKKALTSDKWPEAVNPNLICDPKSESDKRERGIGIIDLIIEDNIKDGRFLDYGCGEGYTVDAAFTALECKIAVGFDTKSYDHWGQRTDNVRFTDSLQQAMVLGPYDAILMFDVIDHLVNEHPTSALKMAADMLAPNGKIYLRCHPWISRHGAHLYQQINKAYAHLVFTDEEIGQLTPTEQEPNIKVTYPIVTYEKFIADAGLKVINKRQITEKVEPFFKIPKIANRIMQNTQTSNFPEFQMSIQFIDYVLQK